MSYDQIRAALKAHFATGLERHLAKTGASGPLDETRIADLFESASYYDQMVRDREHFDPEAHRHELASIILKHRLPVEDGTPAYELLKAEHLKATRDYFTAIAEHSKSLGSYDFRAAPQTNLVVPQQSIDGLALSDLVSAHAKERLRERKGSEKTTKERSRHMALLCEMLDGSTNIRTIKARDALAVKERLATLPPNRTKMRKTRGKAVMEIDAVEGKEALHLRTVNKYLVSYTSMFRWAKRSGYVDQNPFEGLSFNTDNANDEAPRLPFSVEQLAIIRKALTGGKKDVLPHHKWGVLIAMHLGARLNEIAQMHLSDIVERDGKCASTSIRTIRRQRRSA